jgi:hypothetical protein
VPKMALRNITCICNLLDIILYSSRLEGGRLR